MNFVLIFLLSLAAQIHLPSAKYGYDGSIHLPDNSVTPGVVATTNRAQIVGTAWGKDERHVTEKMKKDVCVAYGVLIGCPGKDYEIDHRIPRCAGGADDEKNLWPQPISEAHMKDWLEDRVCAQLKHGTILSVEDAQRIFVGDWYAEYQKRRGNLH